ncbi:MAG: hypothetical protein ACREC6_04060 [Hyphomicrobiaceae bacterium]
MRRAPAPDLALGSTRRTGLPVPGGSRSPGCAMSRIAFGSPKLWDVRACSAPGTTGPFGRTTRLPKTKL